MAKHEIANKARKFLSGLPAQQYKQLASAILDLLTDPSPHDSMALKGSSRGERRVDVGEYRVIYVLSGDTVHVLAVGKRNDDEVYKTWTRIN
jgi:mRNA interferase RelE/StbE